MTFLPLFFFFFYGFRHIMVRNLKYLRIHLSAVFDLILLLAILGWLMPTCYIKILHQGKATKKKKKGYENEAISSIMYLRLHKIWGPYLRVGSGRWRERDDIVQEVAILTKKQHSWRIIVCFLYSPKLLPSKLWIFYTLLKPWIYWGRNDNLPLSFEVRSHLS